MTETSYGYPEKLVKEAQKTFFHGQHRDYAVFFVDNPVADICLKRYDSFW